MQMQQIPPCSPLTRPSEERWDQRPRPLSENPRFGPEGQTGWTGGSTHTRSLKPQKLFGAANSFYKAGLCSDSSN